MRSVLIAASLLAAFAIGFNAATGLHEAGHAAGCWQTGGHVAGIVPRPFAQSYTVSDCRGVAASVWGGVGYGSAAAMLLWATAARRRAGTWRLLAGTAAALGLGINGLYLTVGSLQPFDDAANMIALGAPRLLLLVLGLPLVAGFVHLLAEAVRSSGLTSGDRRWKWIAVTEGGLLLYPLAMVAYAGFIAPPPRPAPFVAIGFLVAFAACFLAVALVAHRRAIRAPAGEDRAAAIPRWSHALALLSVALLIVAGELVAF